MAKPTLHFSASVTVSPILDAVIMGDPLQRKAIERLYVEHRKAARKQYQTAQNVGVKHMFDTIYTLESGAQIAIMSEVVKVSERDVYVETTALSMAEYAERTRKLTILAASLKPQPPIQ